MQEGWPALTTQRVRWTPGADGLVVPSRRARREVPDGYDAAVVPLVAGVGLRLDGDLAADLDDAARLLTAFDSGGAGEIAPFATVLLRSESAASSQIENLTSSARALAEAAIGQGSRANATVILANVSTMQAALDLAGSLDTATVLAMHRALMAHQRLHEPGRWRDQQVWLGGAASHPAGAAYVPPVAADVPALMDDLVALMDRDDLPPLALAALAHAQFETIHPFTDGNGRTGRALLHSVLLHTGVIRRVTVPISAGLLADRAGYFAALTAYRRGDPEPILRCVAEAARTGTRVGGLLVGRLRDLRAGWDEVVTARRGATVWLLLDLVLRQPVVTARVVADELAVSTPTAQAALQHAVECGVLVESTGHRRNRVYRSTEVLSALDDYAENLGQRRS